MTRQEVIDLLRNEIQRYLPGRVCLISRLQVWDGIDVLHGNMFLCRIATNLLSEMVDAPDGGETLMLAIALGRAGNRVDDSLGQPSLTAYGRAVCRAVANRSALFAEGGEW